MSLSKQQVSDIVADVREVAVSVGAWVRQQRPVHIEKKEGLRGAAQVVTHVDREAEERIVASLKTISAGLDVGLLTEERPDDGSRFTSEFFWSIDPLDGTLPYLESRSGYSVSIALVTRSGTPILGVVYDPEREEVYLATRDGKLEVPPTVATNTLSVFVDRSMAERAEYGRINRGLANLAARLGLAGASVHVGAGAVMNACQVLRGARSCYFKFPKPQVGGGSVWDFAATACLFREAGAIASDMAGGALDLNRADSTFMNHRGVLYASDGEVAAGIRDLWADLQA